MALSVDIAPQDAPLLLFRSADEWAAWITSQPATSPGAWLKISRKGSTEASLSYDEALQTAIAFGWIDGQKGTFDDAFWLQRFTPRRRSSKWSKRNRAIAEALIEDGQMHESGHRAVEEAKANGSWDRAYDSQATAVVPADLRAALDRDPDAAAFFDALDSANRYSILFRLQDAKRPDTRAKRLQRFVAMLHAGQKIHP